MNKTFLAISLLLLLAVYGDSIGSLGEADTISGNQPDTALVNEGMVAGEDKLVIAVPENAGIPLPVQKQFKSASNMAKGGVALCGFGMTVGLVGMLKAVAEIPALIFEGSDDGLSTGVYIVLTGSAISAAGTVVTNLGGVKARNLAEKTYGSAERFKGWKYLGLGIGLSVCGSALSTAEMPVVPFLLSATGAGFTIASMVHSVRYTNRAYLKSIASDITLTPMSSSKDLAPIGVRLNFSLARLP